MKLMADRLIMSRLVRRDAAGREFDVEFWQRLGDEKKCAAVRDLVVTEAAIRGVDAGRLELQRTIAVFRRRTGAIPDSRRLCGDQA